MSETKEDSKRIQSPADRGEQRFDAHPSDSTDRKHPLSSPSFPGQSVQIEVPFGYVQTSLGLVPLGHQQPMTLQQLQYQSYLLQVQCAQRLQAQEAERRRQQEQDARLARQIQDEERKRLQIAQDARLAQETQASEEKHQATPHEPQRYFAPPVERTPEQQRAWDAEQSSWQMQQLLKDKASEASRERALQAQYGSATVLHVPAPSYGTGVHMVGQPMLPAGLCVGPTPVYAVAMIGGVPTLPAGYYGWV